MKNDVMPSFVKMDADELKVLLTEVKETVATEFGIPDQAKTFCVADMWNIRRHAKSASSMLRR